MKIFLQMKNILLSILIICNYSLYAQSIEKIKVNDSRTYEVTAIQIDEDTVLSVWMEAKPEREVLLPAGNMQVAYSISNDIGSSWSKKKGLEVPQDTFITGNPYLTKDENGNILLSIMRLNNDFFSGDLAIYQYDIEKEKFHLSSIPTNTTDSLLDKPALSFCGDKLHLFYIEMSKMLDKGIIYHQYSRDSGITWTKPKAIPQDEEIIYLGVDAHCLHERLILSYGSYWYKHIYFSKATIEQDTILFENAKQVADVSKKLVSGLTELSVHNKGNMAIGWFYHHQPKETYLTTSKNEGEDWSGPLLLSDKGNLLSFDYDKNGDLHCIFTEYKEGESAVVYNKFKNNDLHNKVANAYLKGFSKVEGEKDYIGAFQKLLITDAGHILSFWVDYANDSKLYLSKWEDK